MSEYCDIVLIGRTGQGKTTLERKLLDVKNTDSSEIRQFQSSNHEVQLRSNEVTKVRILDMPGFSGPSKAQQTTHQRNAEITELIGVVQEEFNLCINRVVYFLPVRGPLEKADGAMQEELKLLNHYFGKKIFDCMVVVATNPKRMQVEFEQDDVKCTQEVFHETLKLAVEEEEINCPPVKYISLSDSPAEVVSKIQDKAIPKDTILPRMKENVGLYPDRVDLDLDEFVHVKWHPSLAPKYTPTEKFIGGIGHMATGGVALLYSYWTGTETWPGFTNSDEVCTECMQSPKTEGCTDMSQ